MPATLEEARSFPLAEAVFREVVRVHPPFGMITRLAEEDFLFAERTIRKGTLVGIDLAWLQTVQFAVALVRTAERHKLRPRLLGPEPKPVYLPTEHPPARTRVAFG